MLPLNARIIQDHTVITSYSIHYTKLYDNGSFTNAIPSHGYCLEGEKVKRWELLYQLRIEALEDLKLTSAQRNGLLDELLLYYSLHMEGLTRLKSLPIIRQLFE